MITTSGSEGLPKGVVLPPGTAGGSSGQQHSHSADERRHLARLPAADAHRRTRDLLALFPGGRRRSAARALQRRGRLGRHPGRACQPRFTGTGNAGANARHRRQDATTCLAALCTDRRCGPLHQLWQRASAAGWPLYVSYGMSRIGRTDCHADAIGRLAKASSGPRCQASNSPSTPMAASACAGHSACSATSVKRRKTPDNG